MLAKVLITFLHLVLNPKNLVWKWTKFCIGKPVRLVSIWHQMLVTVRWSFKNFSCKRILKSTFLILFWQIQTLFLKANSVCNSKFALFELVSSSIAGIEFCLGWIIVHVSETCFFYFSWKKTLWQMNNSSAIGQVVFVKQNILPRLLFFLVSKCYQGKVIPSGCILPSCDLAIEAASTETFLKS